MDESPGEPPGSRPTVWQPSVSPPRDWQQDDWQQDDWQQDDWQPTDRPPSSQSPAGRRRRTRQVIGVIIAVAVMLVAYGSQYLPVGRSSRVSVVPASPTTCPTSIYPSGAQYQFEQCVEGRPITWQRCSTLIVVVDPTGAPSSWAEDVANSLGQIGRATGLRFRTASHGEADITIGWTSTLPVPAGSEYDKVGVTTLRSRSSSVGAQLISADIGLSTLLSGGEGRNGELPVLLHELGHAVGLGHYTGPDVMNPVVQGFASLQSGDLAGLARLYDPATCSSLT